MSKRNRSRSNAPRRNVSQSKPVTQAQATVARPTEAPKAHKDADNVDFASEYSYVLSDLKRLGLLAAAMFATLVVLALVLA